MGRVAASRWGACVVVVGLGLPKPGHACSPSFCNELPVAPAEGVTVPANAPAVVVIASDPSRSQFDPALIGLFDEGGNPVAFTTVGPDNDLSPYLIEPTAPLTEGRTYRLSYPDLACVGPGSPSTPVVRQRIFDAGPAMVLPTRIGAVKKNVSSVEKRDVWTTSGSCTAPATVAVATVTVEPTAELDAYLGVTNLLVSIDGAVSQGFAYGNKKPGDPIEIELTATCHADDPGVDRGIPAGHHRVKLSATIAGAGENPPDLAFDVDLDCPHADDAGCDCSVARRPTSAGTPIGALAAALALLARRAASRRDAHR